jgi:hypothetical protein
MLTHSQSRSTRAALMATLTKITVVVFQLALAVALFRKVEGAVERPSVPCIVTVRGEGGPAWRTRPPREATRSGSPSFGCRFRRFSCTRAARALRAHAARLRPRRPLHALE